MIRIKSLVAGTIMSMVVVTSTSAQCPTWADSNPGSFTQLYPDRDLLNGWELNDAGRMVLELPGSGAPALGPSRAYEAMGNAAAYAQTYRSSPAKQRQSHNLRYRRR
jgi:hypothetical protein